MGIVLNIRLEEETEETWLYHLLCTYVNNKYNRQWLIFTVYDLIFFLDIDRFLNDSDCDIEEEIKTKFTTSTPIKPPNKINKV